MTIQDSMAQFEESAQRFLGKSIRDCDWDDLQRLRTFLVENATRELAVADRAKSALDEVEGCGCKVAVPDGDIGRALPVHTCGRAA